MEEKQQSLWPKTAKSKKTRRIQEKKRGCVILTHPRFEVYGWDGSKRFLHGIDFEQLIVFVRYEVC